MLDTENKIQVTSILDSMSIYEKIEFKLIHSDVFKRLANKTQVFDNINGSNGHKYRTRFSHSLEVGQLSQFICSALGFNKDLARLFGYMHDIGHAPFGHAGQDSLNKCMSQYDDFFEHNHQAYRSLTVIENLDLPKEIKFGLLKNKKQTKGKELEFSNDKNEMPVIECQICDKADVISYTSGDIEDALNLNIVSLNDLLSHAPFLNNIIDSYNFNNEKDIIDNIHSIIMNYFTNNLIQETKKYLTKNKITTNLDVINHTQYAVLFSEKVIKELSLLREFMYKNVYASEERKKERIIQSQAIEEVFNKIMNNPKDYLPRKYMKRYENGQCTLARTVCDYVSGCDDKFIFQLKDN